MPPVPELPLATDSFWRDLIPLLKQAVQEELFAALDTGDEGLFAGSEEGFRQGWRRLGETVYARLAQRCVDQWEAEHPPAQEHCPRCRRKVQNQGRKPRTFRTLMGVVDLHRCYVRCRWCGESWCPAERGLGIAPDPLSPGAQARIVKVAALVSYDRASELLAEAYGLTVSATTVGEVCEAVGRDLQRRQDTEPGLAPPLTDRRGQPSALGVIQLDGVSAPVRRPGGRDYREVRVLRLEDGDGEQTTLHAMVGDHDAVMETTSRLVNRRMGLGLDQRVDQSLFVRDGARWMAHDARRSLPGVEQVLDFFHLFEHVAEWLQVVAPQDASTRQAQRERLTGVARHQGGVALRAAVQAHHDEVVAALGDDAARTEPSARRAALEAATTALLQYVDGQLPYTDYPRYRARGWPIGSGGVESACKQVVTQRLKGAGMAWSARRLPLMANLRALYLSPLSWNAYWELRRQECRVPAAQTPKPYALSA